YRTGEFLDLCRGPHVKSTRELKAFKLLRVAGAYWRAQRRQLRGRLRSQPSAVPWNM
ncbi:MAG TPA: hypothetical protein VIX89_02830, partial [Bryobacteraceae bacterium]